MNEKRIIAEKVYKELFDNLHLLMEEDWWVSFAGPDHFRYCLRHLEEKHSKDQLCLFILSIFAEKAQLSKMWISNNISRGILQKNIQMTKNYGKNIKNFMAIHLAK